MTTDPNQSAAQLMHHFMVSRFAHRPWCTERINSRTDAHSFTQYTLCRTDESKRIRTQTHTRTFIQHLCSHRCSRQLCCDSVFMPMKDHEALISKLDLLCGKAVVPCLRTASVLVVCTVSLHRRRPDHVTSRCNC